MSNQENRLCRIVLDRANKIYKPGDLLSGKVLTEFTQPIKIKGLRVDVFGESIVGWTITVDNSTDEGSSQTVESTNREDYLSEKRYVIGSDTGRPMEIPAAPLSYAFSIQLPKDLPSSFWHEWGCVYYGIKAVIERPWSFNYEVEASFTIVSNYDLNQKPEASVPIHIRLDKTFCFFCICPWGKMHMAISVPSTGFVPDETIPITVFCQNESTVDVSKITVFLQRQLKFHAMTPKPNERKRSDIIVEKQYDHPYTTAFEENVTVRLQVPQLPPSGLEYCSIIDLSYSLKVVISFSGLHCRVERTFPILIGSVPLRESSKRYGSDVAMALPSPSTSVIPEQASASTPYQMSQTSGLPEPDSRYSDQWKLKRTRPPSYDAIVHRDQSTRDTDNSGYQTPTGSSRVSGNRIANYGSINEGQNASTYEKL